MRNIVFKKIVFFPLIFSFFISPFSLVGCNNKSEITFECTCDTEGLNLSNTYVKPGVDFATTLTLNNPNRSIGCVQVIIDGKPKIETRDYVYMFNEDESFEKNTLHITHLALGKHILVNVSTIPSKMVSEEEPEEFIKNRTFSILASGMVGSETQRIHTNGWIADDATPDNNDDYSYYLVTTRRAIKQFDLLKNKSLPDSYKVSYADFNLAGDDNIIPYTSYYEFSDFHTLGDSNLLITQDDFADFETRDPEYYKPCVDVRVTKVNFDNAPAKIKKKLDKLNNIHKENGAINNFVNYNALISKKRYVGGYRKNTSTEQKGVEWIFRSVENGDFPTIQAKYYGAEATSFQFVSLYQHQLGHLMTEDVYPDKNQQGNIIWYGNEQYYYYDISAQYQIHTNEWNEDPSQMFLPMDDTGMMAMGEKNQIFGIYWGGWWPQYYENQFYPAFSCLKMHEKDITAHWFEE